MSTLGSILSIANTGLRVQQAALSVVSHNIANAAAEGYSRQRAVLGTNPAMHTQEGAYGTGVRVAGVQQMRDALLDAAFRAEVESSSEEQTRADLLARVETVFGEPADEALSGVLDRFLSAWSDLASSPSSAAARTVVRQRGQELVDSITYLVSSMDTIRQEAEARTAAALDRVNALTAEVARLNREVVSAESAGMTAGDLRDTRARALDELAALIPVRATERENGSVGVEYSGRNITDGAYDTPLELTLDGGQVGIAVAGGGGRLDERGGTLGGLLSVLNTDLPGVLSGLDALAAALVEDVNAIHATGTNAAGETDVDFFDASGTTAWTLRLSDEVQASADAIAAGTGGTDALGDPLYRAGANDVALAMAGLRDTELSSLGMTPGEHLRGLVSSLGLAVRSSTDSADVHRTLADQADVRRQSLSSVSVDEELVRLIQFQSAYRAAARVVSTADEMMETVLAI